MANWTDALRTAKSLASSADSKTGGYFSNIAMGAGAGALVGGAAGGYSDNGTVLGGMVGGATLGAGLGGGLKYLGASKKVGIMTDAVSPATSAPTPQRVINLPNSTGQASPSIQGMSAGNDLSYKPKVPMMNDANYNASGSVAASRQRMNDLIATRKKGNSIDYSPVDTLRAPNWSLQDKAYSNSINYN